MPCHVYSFSQQQKDLFLLFIVPHISAASRVAKVKSQTVHGFYVVVLWLFTLYVAKTFSPTSIWKERKRERERACVRVRMRGGLCARARACVCGGGREGGRKRTREGVREWVSEWVKQWGQSWKSNYIFHGKVQWSDVCDSIVLRSADDSWWEMCGSHFVHGMTVLSYIHVFFVSLSWQVLELHETNPWPFPSMVFPFHY
jgi:hypothetical protein